MLNLLLGPLLSLNATNDFATAVITNVVANSNAAQALACRLHLVCWGCVVICVTAQCIYCVFGHFCLLLFCCRRKPNFMNSGLLNFLFRFATVWAANWSMSAAGSSLVFVVNSDCFYLLSFEAEVYSKVFLVDPPRAFSHCDT